MKSLLIALLLAGSLAATAQDAAPTVKVTTVLHPDGTRTETQTDLEAGTSEARTLTKADKLVKKIVYKLDAQGFPTEGVVYNAKDQPQHQFAYSRDPFGRIAEERNFTMEGKPIGRFVYTYNSAGRLANIEAFDANGNPIRSGGSAATPAKKKQQPATRRTR